MEIFIYSIIGDAANDEKVSEKEKKQKGTIIISPFINRPIVILTIKKTYSPKKQKLCIRLGFCGDNFWNEFMVKKFVKTIVIPKHILYKPH